jgi:hypothetical protein
MAFHQASPEFPGSGDTPDGVDNFDLAPAALEARGWQRTSAFDAP